MAKAIYVHCVRVTWSCEIKFRLGKCIFLSSFLFLFFHTLVLRSFDEKLVLDRISKIYYQNLTLRKRDVLSVSSHIRWNASLTYNNYDGTCCMSPERVGHRCRCYMRRRSGQRRLSTVRDCAIPPIVVSRSKANRRRNPPTSPLLPKE